MLSQWASVLSCSASTTNTALAGVSRRSHPDRFLVNAVVAAAVGAAAAAVVLVVDAAVVLVVGAAVDAAVPVAPLADGTDAVGPVDAGAGALVDVVGALAGAGAGDAAGVEHIGHEQRQLQTCRDGFDDAGRREEEQERLQGEARKRVEYLAVLLAVHTFAVDTLPTVAVDDAVDQQVL